MVTDEILYTQVPSFNAVFFFFFGTVGGIVRVLELFDTIV